VCGDKFAKMAIAMGENSHKLTIKELARKAIERIKGLFIEVGFPNKIPMDLVDKKDIPHMVKQAMTRPMIKFNRRKCNEKDLAEIYEKAFEGWQ
jgi:alcohol dehydrogenase class IV